MKLSVKDLLQIIGGVLVVILYCTIIAAAVGFWDNENETVIACLKAGHNVEECKKLM